MRKDDAAVEWLRALVSDPDKIIICHNGKFEMKMMAAEGIDAVEEFMEGGATFHDTLIMAKVLDSTSKNHDLRSCAIRYLNRDTGDKDEIAEWVKANNSRKAVRERGRKVNFSDAPDEVVQRRVVWDVETTLLLYHALMPKIQSTCPDLYETERVLCHLCAEMELHGVRVDITRARALRDDALEGIERILTTLRALVGELDIPRSKKGTTILERIAADDFNPGSGAHLEQAFVKLGIELKYKTAPKKNKRTGEYKGGGNWSFDEYAMMRYVPREMAEIMRISGEDGWHADRMFREVMAARRKHRLPKWSILPPLTMKYRELSKMVSTYYNRIIDDAVDREITPNGHEYGILHCRFNQNEAMTGRFSSSDPNLQNIPRIMGPRECFVPRKGHWNFHLDYSQVEMRMFVHFAKDDGMAKAIAGDIHMYVATKVYHKDPSEISKEQRKRAKGTGFGILYGSGAETQAETLTKKGLPTSVKEAQSVVASYHREFPSVKRLTNTLKSQLIREGYVVNPYGRRYAIPSRFGYKALNYMCQGTSADIIKAAMVKCWLWLRSEGYRTRIIMTIHDEIVFEIPRTEQGIIPTLQGMMEDHESFFVPITVDVEIVKRRWSQKSDWISQ